MAHLVSVNVGRPRRLAQSRRGEVIRSAIVKAPVLGRVRVEGVNVAGDDQADRRVHGGPDKAVYAYASEDIAWWSELFGKTLPPAVFGENLTTAGIDVTGAVIGERWQVGTVELEVCQPRLPCVKLGIRFGDPRMVQAFAKASRPGAYLRIVTAGELEAGDAMEVVRRPAHGITIELVSRAILLDRSLRPLAASAPELAAGLLDEYRVQAA